jgi:hypothetical protein
MRFDTRTATEGSRSEVDGDVGQATAAPSTLQTGELVADRYRIERLIASGGMGEVYEALDVELSARVALKTLRADRQRQPDGTTRVKQEILLARMVNHPNVCRPFDFGFHWLEGGTAEVAFFTMELLEGVTLAERISASRMTEAQALPIATQMAEALDAAHRAGVIHRDFKSSNVMLVGAEPRAVVTDFGVARVDEPAEPQMSGFTADFVGSPAYMAPEQVTRREPVGRAADIYALGVVLFEMVTGGLPFEAETPLATAVRRVEEEAPRARSRAPGLDSRWDAAIARCLQRGPTRRFASAQDVIHALTGARPTVPLARRAGMLGALGLVALAALLVPRAELGLAPSCPPLPAGAGDIYVDAHAAPGGSGAESCPLRSVSAAIARTRSSDRHVTIHVARGRYDAALGEEFPMVVRGTVTIAGAGQDRTLIIGSGLLSKRPDGEDPVAYDDFDAQTRQVTMVVGDDRATVELSDLGVSSGLLTPSADIDGIYCERGARSPYAQPAVAANTIIHSVVAGPGYSSAIVAGRSMRPGDRSSACNLAVSDSTMIASVTGLSLHGSWDHGTPASAQVRRCVFSGLRSRNDKPGAGIQVSDGVRRLHLEDSLFKDSDAGVVAVHTTATPAAETSIVRNAFTDLSVYGIDLERSMIVQELVDNQFAFITRPEASKDDRAVALLLDGWPDARFPQIERARGNHFANNNVAVELRGPTPIAANPVIDFGSLADLGRNVFHCNSTRLDSRVPGYDVLISAPGSDGMRLAFAGNVWDHVPPSVASLPAANGTDIVFAGPRHLELETSGAMAASGQNCSFGVLGPP